MNKQHILDEIKRTAKVNGEPLGVARFFQETGIKESDWHGKFWARWGDALREAGFEPNELNKAYPEHKLIEKFISLIRELNRFPVRGEVKIKSHTDESFPSHNVFARFGSKQQLARRILAYCEEHPGYEDVAAYCQPITSRQEPVERNDTDEAAIGFVYLMKSGKFYKLGRSNAAGRREYELSIQMPQKLTTVHTIRTDDPVGIEGYWHQRFEAKRQNGEWFDLSVADVKAFTRRKFM
jgi:Meiotically up-regulated gene 113